MMRTGDVGEIDTRGVACERRTRAGDGVLRAGGGLS